MVDLAILFLLFNLVGVAWVLILTIACDLHPEIKEMIFKRGSKDEDE